MHRSARLIILVALLGIIVAGSALASQSPRSTPPATMAQQSEEPEAPPSVEDVAHAVDRLQAHDIVVSAERISELAAVYGLGGAVRLLAWSDATGTGLGELRSMRDGGMGWGQIAHDLGVSPGLGSIMGAGAGHGRETAPGQE
jgi:hypothetical protein